MKFSPLNGFIQIEPVKEEEKGVLLPEDFSKAKPFTVCKLISLSIDGEYLNSNKNKQTVFGIEIEDDDFIIVETHMIEKIPLPDGKEVFTVPIRGIRGIYYDEK